MAFSSNLLWVLLLIVTESPLRSQNAATPGSTRSPRRCTDYALQENLNSFLWLVKRTPPAYFFGTIHVPYTRVWDYIPTNSKVAFTRSQNVYFELDLTNKPTVNALWKCQMLPKGGLLKDVLPPNMYRRLHNHLRYIKKMIAIWLRDSEQEFRSGIAPYADKIFHLLTQDWQHKRPIWVMLMVNSLTESDIKSRGIPVLDQYLAIEAARNEKFIGAVEEVEEQCRPLNSLNNTEVVFALNQTLNFQEKLRMRKAHLVYTTDDLIDHYNCGDLNSVLFSTQSTRLSKMANSSTGQSDFEKSQEIDKYFRKELIFKRNERMAKRVMDLLENYPERDFFFAFGAGHFLGNHSIIEIMEREGYSLHHVRPEQDLPRFDTPKRVKSRRRKKCRRKRKRCLKRKKKGPDFSSVIFLKVTNTPTKKSEDTIIKQDEEPSNAVPPTIRSTVAVAAAAAAAYRVPLTIRLLCLLLHLLLKGLI